MARIKGTKLTTKLAFLERHYPPEARERVFAALDEGDRRILDGLLSNGWYPSELYERLVAAIVEQAAGGDAGALDRMGRETAEAQAGSAYSGYFRSQGPRQLLERMAPMHAQLNDPGVMEIVPEGEQALTIVVRSPQGARCSCRIARAFYGRAVEMSGAQGVEVVETSCSGEGADACRFAVSWRSA